MLVVITGGAGYVGSVLSRMLLKRGHSVLCIDRLFFGSKSVGQMLSDKNFRVVRSDIRWVEPSAFKGVGAVIDLAAISNDPAGEIDPMKTLDINYLGRLRVAKLAQIAGVDRYLLASTCSVYGFQDSQLSEESKLSPISTYAKASVLAEKDILPMASKEFCVTVLRPATVYGASQRMRFDLAINGMVLGIYKNGVIPVMRDGQQWRPFVHVQDVCDAYARILEARPDIVNGQIFNVGSDEQNYQIATLSRTVGDACGKLYSVEWYGSPDARSYRVRFDKIKDALGYKASYDVAQGSREIMAGLESGQLKDSPECYTLNWYKSLVALRQAKLDEESLPRFI